MSVAVTVEWSGNLKFTANNKHDVSTIMDATSVGDRRAGISPMELLLMALGGCTGIDVVTILQKQRQTLTGLTLKISGSRRAEPPKYYEKIHVEYILKGSNLDEKKVQRAIELSEEKYCSVSAMLKSKAKITSSHRIEQ